VEDLAQIDGPPPTGFRFGRRPLTVDLLTSVQGISFDQAWGESIVSNFDGLRVRIIGIEALLANKRATKRLKDAADVEELERLRALGLLEWATGRPWAWARPCRGSSVRADRDPGSCPRARSSSPAACSRARRSCGPSRRPRSRTPRAAG